MSIIMGLLFLSIYAIGSAFYGNFRPLEIMVKIIVYAVMIFLIMWFLSLFC